MASTYAPYEPRPAIDPPAGYPYQYPPSVSPYDTNNSTVTFPYAKAAEQTRIAARTPSPTPSEQRQLKTGVFDWKTLSKWRFWIRREWLWYYVAIVIGTAITALVSIYHKQIVEWLTPATRWLHDQSYGWAVPIAVLFVISFPPLFGHEIVAVLCGLVWGLWIGFGIVSAGTFLGEVGNFYAFKYCCRSRGEKLERTKITYACLAKVVRDGGFKIALIARLSAIPGHFTTAVFSTCGMGIFVFSLAALLSMPKQFITVYLGVVLEQASTGVKDKKSAIISDIVLAITFIITVLAMWYIFRQMNKVKPEVIYERRKARQAKIARAAYPPYNTGFSASSVDFERGSADSDSIPLKVQAPSIAQSWDTHSEYRSSSSTDLPFYAPRPQHPRLPLPKHPEDLDVVYANAHDEESHGFVSARGYSTDEVGWDMNARPKMIARAEDMYGVPFESTDTVQQQQTKQQPTGRPSPSPSPAAVSSTKPLDAPTPTQAQFASWKPPVDDDDDLPTPLPMPRFREPPREAMAEAHYGHGQEPTDASYTTAREPSSDDQEHPRRTSPRVHSPPPPSYPTSVR